MIRVICRKVHTCWQIVCNWYRFKRLCSISSKYHRAELKRLSKSEEPIRSVFLTTFQSTWKYDGVFKRMLSDSRFEPIILVCPIVNSGYDNMIRYMEETYSFFKNKGYNVIKAYNHDCNSYVDLRNGLKPDILFYTNPYKGLIDDRYYINQYLDKLTIYVSYNYNNGRAFKTFYDLDFHNLVWRHYAETEIHRQYAVENSRNHGKNVVVTGYPGIEPLLLSNGICNHSNEQRNRSKIIIWAPHHTLEKTPYGHTCFLKYYGFMIELAKKYKDDIQVVFKPHPLLKAKLYEYWGKNRTDDYYDQWESMPNTSINDGDYEELFLSSDAMIHDSGSFVVEYLYVNKPVMRTVYDVDIIDQFNSFGIMCLDQHYMGYNEQDVEQFIQNVIKGIDPLKEQRTSFVNEVLMPIGGMPSEIIIKDIIDSIEKQRV